MVDSFVKCSLPCPTTNLQKKQITDERVKTGGSRLQGRGHRYVVGYEGLYTVSKYGAVYSLKTKKYLTQYSIDSRGYQAVGLYKDSKSKTGKVHRLVAQAFIPNPDNKPHVNHIDGNKLNNYASNLEWVTHQENTSHAKANGLMWFQKGKYAKKD